MYIVDKSGLIIYPHEDFLTHTSASARRQWHDALWTTADKQGVGDMIDERGRKCCLQIGLEAWGESGPEYRTGDGKYPSVSSKFSIAVGGHNPCVGRAKGEGLISASRLNDNHALSFRQIAMLIYPEAHPVMQ